MRKMPSRTSGCRLLACITRNSPSRASAPAPTSKVCAEPQPTSGARTMAYTSPASPPVTVAAPTQSWPAAAAGNVRHHPGRQSDDGQGDGDVQVEHPRPRRVLGEDPAEEHPGGPAGWCSRAVQREGLGELLAVAGEQHHQQGQRGRRDESGTGALDGAAGELDGGVAGGTGDNRPGEQDGPAGDEHLAGAEQVGQAAAEQQQPAERDHVGVEHPRQVLGGEAQVGLHLRQGHADDGRVHDDHELGGGDEAERPPAAVARGRRCGRHGSSLRDFDGSTPARADTAPGGSGGAPAESGQTLSSHCRQRPPGAAGADSARTAAAVTLLG